MVEGRVGIGDWDLLGDSGIEGRKSGRFLRRVRCMTTMAREGRRSPSLMRSGSMEKVVTVRAQSRRVARLGGRSWLYSRHMGRAASRIDFSCTWGSRRLGRAVS